MPEIFSGVCRVGQANHEHKTSDFTYRHIGAYNVYYVK